MPTPSIFDFDESKLAVYEPSKANELLAEQPALYINHLHIARFMDGWVERLADSVVDPTDDDQFLRGYRKAISEIAAHLRQGDFVAGGVMLDPVN